ncbi:MAG: homocysteine S-methyltransferase family protein [Desulfobacterales bacterium]
MGSKTILKDRLEKDTVICAEGYLFELERRGYLQAGAFVPEVVLEHPEVVIQLHREFLRAGSDVMVAFTYYAHREKMRLIGKEDLLEELQKSALRMARQVAGEKQDSAILVAGNICNTNIYDQIDTATHSEVRKMFDEQVVWAAEEGVDFIIAETIPYHGEAKLALQAILGAGLEAVINLVGHREARLRDGCSLVDSCLELEQMGATVVGMNCNRGPTTMMPLVKEIRRAVDCHVAAMPVPYRTTPANPTFQSLEDPSCNCIPGNRPFPVALDPFTCNRYEMALFAKDAYEAGIRFIGACCGAGPHHIRAIAETLGRTPEASKYSPDMSKHYALGDDARLKKANQVFAGHHKL